MKRRRSLQMAQNQSHQVLWCSGIKANQDVSIRLVTNERVISLCNRSTLAELKMHSSELKTCSKYFEACLSERWTNPNLSSKEFNLEMLHGLEVASYEECFSHMYMLFRKHFKDVKSSVELLRVASQIEYHELISSIYGYLAGIKWTVEDELKIRQYSSSPDFSRSQAKGLVARLALDGPSKEDDHRVVSELMEKWHLIYSFDELSNKYEVLCHFGFKQAKDNEVLVLSFEKQVELIRQAREDVFLTLPFQQQRDLVERGITFVRPNSFATLLKQNW